MQIGKLLITNNYYNQNGFQNICYYLTMQNDGDLVLRADNDERKFWSLS